MTLARRWWRTGGWSIFLFAASVALMSYITPWEITRAMYPLILIPCLAVVGTLGVITVRAMQRRRE